MVENNENIISNGNFNYGNLGYLPDDWEISSPHPSLTPVFKLVRENGQKLVMATGAGTDNCIGWIYNRISLKGNHTYKITVEFKMSEKMDPNKNLLFAFFSDDYNNGIFSFERLKNSWVNGEGTFFLPGQSDISGEVRIYFKLSSIGKVWIKNIAIYEVDAIPPRKARIACVQGRTDLLTWRKVLEHAGNHDADLILLPETFNPEHEKESLNGSSAKLMSEFAQKYRMYVAGTFLYDNKKDGYTYNKGVIYDRRGNLLGQYNKNHPFSPEFFKDGVVPGNHVPVFKTDFGVLGMMICYDSWFTDVAELLALKGAETILFPSEGYYRSLMPARAADNCVRIIASSGSTEMGIWDTSGAEVTNPNIDPSRHANCENTFENIYKDEIGKIKLLYATLNFNLSPSPHNWGGPLLSAPGGRRNRREQRKLLLDEIQFQIKKWWSN